MAKSIRMITLPKTKDRAFKNILPHVLSDVGGKKRETFGVSGGNTYPTIVRGDFLALHLDVLRFLHI